MLSALLHIDQMKLGKALIRAGSGDDYNDDVDDDNVVRSLTLTTFGFKFIVRLPIVSAGLSGIHANVFLSHSEATFFLITFKIY